MNGYVDSIIRNTRKLISLTNKVLDITKIETNSLSLYKENVDLRMFLLECITDYEKQIKNSIEDRHTQNPSERVIGKTLLDYSQLQENGSHDSFLADVDRSRISQVVSNLLDNAFKFTNDGDTISVEIEKETSSSQEFAVISIKDSGRGIHLEILPRLFTKFATKSDKGTGLGLFICKSIVEAHGGRIWAKNNKDGKGATFSFSLPLEHDFLL
jgi:two-component system sensor histidine kinase VicK